MGSLNSWDITDASNNAPPPDGWPENMNYSEVNNTGRAVQGTMKRYFSDINGTLVGAGIADVYTVTLNEAYAAYFNGMVFRCSIVADNTISNPTIDVNGIGAISIVGADGGGLQNGDLAAGGIYNFQYDGASFRIGGGVGGGIFSIENVSSTVASNTGYTGSGANNFIAGDASTGVTLTTGEDNILIGQQTGALLQTSSRNIAIGSEALGSATVPLTVSDNLAIGYQALFSPNVGVAQRNTFVGNLTGANTLSGASENVAVGYNAGGFNNGDRNVAIGLNAATSVSNADDNTGVGANCMAGSVTGDDNVAVGAGAMNTGANRNVAIGRSAALAFGTGDDNIAIGNLAGPTTFNLSDRLYIDITQRDDPLIGANFLLRTVQMPGFVSVDAIDELEGTFTGAAGTKNLDVQAAAIYRASSSMAGNAITINLTNEPASGRAASVVVILDTASTATITWDAAIDWPGGTEPTWSAGIDIVTFITTDGGTTWYGFLGGQDFQ